MTLDSFYETVVLTVDFEMVLSEVKLGLHRGHFIVHTTDSILVSHSLMK